MFNLILAIDNNRGMGFKGGLPWRLKKDMAFFKAITTSKNLQEIEKKFGIERDGPSLEQEFPPSSSSLNTVIMGRKTWESIPNKFRPLAGRNNIVLSRSKGNLTGGTRVYSSLEEPISALINEKSNVFIIGGKDIYTHGLLHPDCKRIYLTHIYHEYECDTFFEKLPEKFELIGSSNEESEEGVSFRFLVYENGEI